MTNRNGYTAASKEMLEQLLQEGTWYKSKAEQVNAAGKKAEPVPSGAKYWPYKTKEAMQDALVAALRLVDCQPSRFTYKKRGVPFTGEVPSVGRHDFSDYEFPYAYKDGKPQFISDIPKPKENKNLARAVRCGGEVLKAGTTIEAKVGVEDLVVLSVSDLDRFVQACGQIDRV